MTRDAAIEFLALAALRRAGVPLQELRKLGRKLRQGGRSGPEFLALGADGRTALIDGAGDDVPLTNPKTGQAQLFVTLDLRRLRRDIEAIVDDLR